MPCGRALEKHGPLMFGDPMYPWDEGDNIHKMMVRELQRGRGVWRAHVGEYPWGACMAEVQGF